MGNRLTFLSGLTDSKDLSPERRTKFYYVLKNHPQVFFSSIHITSGTIDKLRQTTTMNVIEKAATKQLLQNFQQKLVSQIKSKEISVDEKLNLDKVLWSE